jgi:hypothetical protein
MEKARIKSIENYNNHINYFRLENKQDLNVNICGLLETLGFDKEKINNFDIAYDAMDKEYIFDEDKKLKVHVFITKEDVFLVIDSQDRKKINKAMGKYFEFPTDQ